ncbi:MAG: HPr family phosphocarrier protein [Desulfurococcaceae archaeon]
MRTIEVKVINRSGLHARPAARFVQLAMRFKSNIMICKESSCVDAKNILKVLSLGVDCGDLVIIKTNGPDEDEALKHLLDLLQNVLPSEDR